MALRPLSGESDFWHLKTFVKAWNEFRKKKNPCDQRMLSPQIYPSKQKISLPADLHVNQEEFHSHYSNVSSRSSKSPGRSHSWKCVLTFWFKFTFNCEGVIVNTVISPLRYIIVLRAISRTYQGSKGTQGPHLRYTNHILPARTERINTSLSWMSRQTTVVAMSEQLGVP